MPVTLFCLCGLIGLDINILAPSVSSSGSDGQGVTLLDRSLQSVRLFSFFILQVPFILVSWLGHRRALEMSLELYEEVGFIETTASAFGRFFDSVQRRDLRQHIVGKPEA